jgi:hypothetical protein
MTFLLEFSDEALRPNERSSLVWLSHPFWGENLVEAVSFGIALVYALNASPAAFLFVCCFVCTLFQSRSDAPI